MRVADVVVDVKTPPRPKATTLLFRFGNVADVAERVISPAPELLAVGWLAENLACRATSETRFCRADSLKGSTAADFADVLLLLPLYKLLLLFDLVLARVDVVVAV